ILSTHDLSRHFGGVAALNLVSMDITDKKVHSIIGPNGAGKTTLINVITGLLEASGGKVVYQDKDITTRPIHDRVRMGLCRTFQITSIFMGLSVRENIRIAKQAQAGGSLRVFSRRENLKEVGQATEAIIRRVGLEDVADVPANCLAHGDQRVLEVAIALAGNPKLVLLDEPAAGMSPTETDQVSELIKSLGREMAVVLVEHDMEVVMTISDRVTVLHQGGIIADGSPEEISGNEQVKRAYLGTEENWAPLIDL
ncbi:ABC transporter ATP-binding protein, partial [Patescibacteria group bacterium]|nr:ABC transporter ATP-binding protein [Patescibacteria group bacterium]